MASTKECAVAGCSAGDTELLKQCSACKKVYYCGEQHQKDDWKTHKPLCKQSSTIKSPLKSKLSASAPSFSPDPSTNFQSNFLNSLSDDPLSNLSRQEVYARLIDAYRLRIEDEYTFCGEASGLYGDEDPLPEFHEFIQDAVRNKVVPEWWDRKKDWKEIKKVALTDKWANINHAVEKSDIVEHYHSFMPMELRVLAEKVTGRPVTSYGF